MPFDVNHFMNQKFEARTAKIPVPDLKEFFSEDEEPEFEIRGLTGEELIRCQDAAQKYKDVQKIIDGILSKDPAKMAEVLRINFDMDPSKTPERLVNLLNVFLFGVVQPKADMSFAVRFAKNFPVEFILVTNKINELTGKGAIAKKKPLECSETTT